MRNPGIRATVSRCLALLALAGIASTADADSSGRWQNGQEVYDKVCGYCHEINVGPVLKGRSLPVEYIQYIVRHGNRAMPSFRPSEIDDDMLAQLARLISGKSVQ